MLCIKDSIAYVLSKRHGILKFGLTKSGKNGKLHIGYCSHQ
nr:MAG TPA: hypothetical protein [Caudoviricetes sp.]